MSEELCVLTRVTNTTSDAEFDEAMTIIDTLEGLQKKFNLSKGVPFGWRLLKGKKAERHIKKALKEEAQYQRHLAMKKAAGGTN